jgi:hypothetical protein
MLGRNSQMLGLGHAFNDHCSVKINSRQSVSQKKIKTIRCQWLINRIHGHLFKKKEDTWTLPKKRIHGHDTLSDMDLSSVIGVYNMSMSTKKTREGWFEEHPGSL